MVTLLLGLCGCEDIPKMNLFGETTMGKEPQILHLQNLQRLSA